MIRDVLVLCMNPHSEHMYGILSGDPMAYYLFSLKHETKVFFSVHSLAWGDLEKEPNIKDGYIYNQGKLRWHFFLDSFYESVDEVRGSGKRSYIPPYRIGYEGHKRWYLLSNMRELRSEYYEKISEKIFEKNFVRLKRFKFYVRGSNEIKPLQTNRLNAAICKTSVLPPTKEDVKREIRDPNEIIENLIRTDLRESRLLEETIERAYLLKLLTRGTYPTDRGSETVVWLTDQRVLERTRKRYDVAFRLKESGRYVAVEFKRGEGFSAMQQLKDYIEELKREENIQLDASLLPRIVCEHRSEDLLMKARDVLGSLVDVEEYHLNITFSHERIQTQSGTKVI